jgi:hypothetical protein
MHSTTNSDARKLRGRSAIEVAHAGLTGEDEARLDATISSLYNVESEEAGEIHVNYHVGRLLLLLAERARKNGMKKETLAKRARQLDMQSLAHQIAEGRMVEAAALDVLFRNLSKMESHGKVDDRYMNFYG